jgi:hypothetical protein
MPMRQSSNRSGLLFGKRFPRKIVRVGTPVSQTGYSHSRCCRRHTKDCSRGISGEHPISHNVLKELSAPTVLVDGVPWLAVGERREMPIAALESNILCARHNAAFSDLDTEAGLFVKEIKEIRTTNGQFLSQRSSLTILSGEALEIWALKVAFGLFYAKYAAQSRQHLLGRRTIDHSLMDQALRASGNHIAVFTYLEPSVPRWSEAIRSQSSQG